MQATETENGNQLLVALPALNLAGAQFIYREAPWIEALIRAVLAACGVLLIVLAWRSAAQAPLGFASLFVGGAGTMIYGAIYLHSRHSLNFICTADGLFFPERRGLAAAPRLWLFVPWRNVLEYRVQRMLDETSSRGVMLAIRATAYEETTFFGGHRLFRLAALRPPHGAAAILIGFSTFLPRPETVVAQLRRFESRADDTATTSRLALDPAA